MGSTVRSMIEISFAFAAFLAAITVGFYLFQNGSATVHTAYLSNQSLERNVQPTLSVIAGDGSVSGAEALQSIGHIGDIGVDIVVDGTIFTVGQDRGAVDVSTIKVHGTYAATYQRGPQGELQRVIYTSK